MKNVRLAYDQDMVTETEDGLQIIMENVNELSHKYGMKNNIQKTKVLVISRQCGGVVNISKW